MAGVKASKQILRKEIKALLAGLTDEEKIRQSGVVAEKLFAMNQWQSCRRISLFLNMSDEIRTDGILKAALEANKLCFIPRYVGSCMEMLRLRSWDDYLSLPETSWKIKQPPADDNTRESAMNTDGLDLVLVPGLGFNHQGHRLGRGKGYYDTFLTNYIQKFGRLPVTVGLAFKEQITDNIPVAEYDISLDFVLYDNEEST